MWNPFTIDDDGDRIDLSGALTKVQDELDQLYLENKMATIKKSTKKTDESEPEVKAKKKAAEPAKKTESKKDTKHPRATPDGYVGLTELSKELGLTPAALRRKLRASDITKPDDQHGWYWKDGSKDLAGVRKAMSK